MMLLQQDTKAARRAEPTTACARAARRGRSLRKAAGSEPQRPPISTAKTCKNHKVASRRARYLGVATLTPCCLLKGEARLTVSSGRWVRGWGGSCRQDSARRTLPATRALAIWQTLATARSSGRAREARAPEVAQAARWSPSGPNRPRQAQSRGASGSAGMVIAS